MALEQYKTQVLLLHSQQSTLDSLSAGFGDRYSVHLATSGTEALSTLGITPIHVIVSAQDLPGMSGLEALREAKKRSPETIGILLAGTNRDDGLEALVGDKEVFQIVRGAVTAESLQNLIDAATKKVRLLTLAESANDLAANVDEPVGEHIIMETADNGTTIISDGTGKMPVLRPRQVHISPHAGGREVEVLVLTQDDDFLETIRDSSRESHTVHHANTRAQAEEIVRDHTVGVLVTDAAMVGSTIEIITERLRKDRPRLVAVVAGRRDDGELLMDLINRGQVYRFLLKPVSPGRARLAIEASVKHHLEAADSAFKGKPRADAAAPPGNRKHIGPARISRISPQKGTAAPPRAAPLPPRPKAPQAQPAGETAVKPIGDQPDSAFSDSGRFRQTMTGLAATLGRSLGTNRDGEEAAPTASASTRSGRRISMLTPGRLATGAGAALLVAASAWWLASSDTAGPPTTGAVPAETDATVASPSVMETDVPGRTTRPAGAVETPAPAYQRLLNQARDAREQGELVVPPGSNAIELYVAAREIAPDEPAIAAELEQVVTTALGLAESALLDQRTADAAQTLRLVRLAAPQNPRLPFLEAQLGQLQQRAQMEQARAAIRERRFEDAATALQNAEALAGADSPEIAAIVEELAAARSSQRVDEVLALASQRLEQNALVEPANDNARYYYELALSNDPENTVARQGLTIVAGKLVLRARESMDTGQLEEAERYLRDAGALDRQSADLNASLQALANARAERLAAAEAEAERQAELERREAAALAQQAAEAEAGDGVAPDATRADDVAGGVAELQDGPARAEDDLVSGLEPGSAATERTGTPGAGEAGGSAPSTVSPGEYVAISTLKRVNYVAPRYPRSAQRRNITGWVDVSFRVDRGGSVANVEVLDSHPGQVFSDAATEAVSAWRFEPALENGGPVERLVAVRLMFDLE